MNLHLQRLERVAVFRALVLGDMLCAVPALRALRHACPDAELTLVGLPWAREWAQRLLHVDRFIEFPGYPGLPETIPDLEALPGFLQQMQAERFELLLQLHGSGAIVNPLLAACGAERLAGFVQPGGFCPEPALFAPWPEAGHEIERLLALTDHLGLPRQGTQLEFPLTDSDRIELATLWPGAFGGEPYVCVHAGAQLASRRWPPERFAAVADALAARGLTVVLTGSSGEAALAAQLRAAMRHPAVDLSGKTSLWTLAALLERARLLVCNDTGVSHIAAAIDTPSVVVSCGADVSRWAPLETRRHQVLWQPMPCRPCGHAACPYEHGCATGIEAPAVIQAAEAMLHRTRDRRVRPRPENRPLSAIAAAPRPDERPQLREDEALLDWNDAAPEPPAPQASHA
jgi:ADP-heptose:LPS heptosyltransferase